jgi:glycosyltransferase involved in cell wall biosynthesis
MGKIMNDEVMVSVSCITYNHEKYIRRCLEGFVMQKTNFKFEVIVHDDASTDNTATIIREYEMRYPDIIKAIYQKENQYSQGISIKKKFMLPRLRGKYIAICEGDDWWTDEEKLQRQFEYMESHTDCSICTHNAIIHYIKTGEKRINNTVTYDKDFSINDIIISDGNLFVTNSYFVKREYYFNIPDCFACKGVGDYQLVMYATMNGTCHYLANIMSQYNNGTRNSWTERVYGNPEKRVIHFKQMIDMLKKVDQYYNYQYSKPINKKIAKLEFDIYLLNKDKSIVVNKKHYKYYMATLLGKIYYNVAVWITAKFPFTIEVKQWIDQTIHEHIVGGYKI